MYSLENKYIALNIFIIWLMKQHTKLYIFPIFSILLLLQTGYSVQNDDSKATPIREPSINSGETLLESSVISYIIPIILPLNGALERITKKKFWLKVSPSVSPISPERFTGYHTRVDFETYPSEQNIPVGVRAICTGQIISKKWATRYGGVAVQRCQLQKQSVTIVYGNMQLESIGSQVNEIIQAGEPIWVLGTENSKETDSERKHLHLVVYLWSNTDIRGYVGLSKELNESIDPIVFIKGL